MFGFSIMKPSFSFTKVKAIAIPAVVDHVKANGHNI